MAGKFKLIPNPTFTGVVVIPTPGSEEGVELGVTFNHLSMSKLLDLQKDFAERSEKLEKRKGYKPGDEAELMVEFLKVILSGWDIEDEFNDENLRVVVENHPRFFDSVSGQYQQALWSVRQK